jgi:hypothetical protein
VEVGPAGGHAEHSELGDVQGECLDDVGTDALCGGGGEAYDGDIWEFFLEEGQLLERRPEIVAPFADTMGFIDCNTGKLFLGVDDPEDLAEVIALTKFGGNIE